MLFNSIEYIIFFPLVVILYFAIPHRFRWMILLTASYYFYMAWKAEYAVLLLLSTSIAYYTGILIGETESEVKKKRYLIISVVSSLGILFGFKYFNFFNDSARTFFNQINIFYDVPYFNVLLPIGISFYTFQTLSYSIDVFRGETKPEKHFGIFALYVSFFPQLVAGPIERSTRLLPQFFEKKKFDYQRATDGLKLILWGFFKKIVIADRLALYVDQVYNNPTEYYGLHLLLATYFFAFQIYCDFSGYTDIARGSAKVMGYDLMQNFQTPYFATDIADFWRRWHISLSTWFRDYLFIPLNLQLRYVKWGGAISIIITFLLCGLWHGANWTFIIWGGLHGFYLASAIITKSIRIKISEFFHLDRNVKLQQFLKIFITFHLVVFGWIFFRANSLSDALLIIQNIFVIDLGQVKLLKLTMGWYELLIAVSSIVFMESVHLIQRKTNVLAVLNSKPMLVRFAVYYVLIFGILIFGQFKESVFIYFQF